MKVTIEQDRCIAAGQCVAHAPDVFDQRDEDGIVVLLEDRPADGRGADVRDAAAACPALAIHVDD